MEVIADWGLKQHPGSILDPSYGGCAFLSEAIARVGNRSSSVSVRGVYGVDIDPETDRWRRQLVEAGVPKQNLLTADFLEVSPGKDLPMVDLILGNPPYVRHHWMSKSSSEWARGAARDAGVSLSGRSSLWAYFVAHSVRFVLPGGGLALLLPGSAVNADYAKPLYPFLCARFGFVGLVKVTSRVFAEAQEETIVLIASGAGKSSKRVIHAETDGPAGLARILDAWPDSALESESPDQSFGLNELKYHALSSGTKAVLQAVHSAKVTSTLSEIANVRIGTVTGANRFFLLNLEEAEALEVAPFCTPVLAGSLGVSRPTLTSDDLSARAALGRKTLMLTIPSTAEIIEGSPLASYIREGEDSKLHTRWHTRRDPWWSLRIGSIPDAFLPYMGGRFRGLVENAAKAASPNSLHHVNWKETTTRDQSTVAILSSWSTFTALYAEVNGRSYGGGVLKTEVGPAGGLPVLTASDTKIPDLKNIDASQVRSNADQLFAAVPGINSNDWEELSADVRRLASRRKLDAVHTATNVKAR